jgi:hypothetical protein
LHFPAWTAAPLEIGAALSEFERDAKQTPAGL